MELIRTISGVRSHLGKLRKKGKSTGFVPTMGALHRGHITLVEQSVKENDFTVVSIFVNPTQFNEYQDFKFYPRNLDHDIEMLENTGTDIVFAPAAEEMYPEKDTRVFDFGKLEHIMEGKHRPGHFNGVAQVVSRLLNIVEPDRAYFGEKDFQQLAIIRKLSSDLKISVEIRGCPIIREADGLAMSSRNSLLSKEERIAAAKISSRLFSAKKSVGKLPVIKVKKEIEDYFASDPVIDLEYFEIVDEYSLEPIADWSEGLRKRACIAVRIGSVRLIDNMDFSF